VRFSSTPAQCEHIERLMKLLDLDPVFITLMHKPLLEKAGFAFAGNDGKRVADFTCGLTKGQASTLIDVLVAKAGAA
jgi:hypothetical protein